MKDARSSRITLLRRNGPFKVAAAAVTLWSFLFNTLIPLDLAWAARTPLELTRVGSNRAGIPGFLPAPFDLNNLSLPLRLGEIKDTFKGTNGHTIIHIQDAHCNYGAQTAIEGIIRHLTDTYNNVNLISLEGGAGNYDLSLFTDIKDPEIRRKVSDYFVREGRVSGPEFFAINNPDKVKLFGVEDARLYLENLDAYRNSLPHKEEIDKSLNTLQLAIANLKSKTYTPELKSLDERIRNYRDNKINFKDHILFLNEMGSKDQIDLKGYKNLSSLVAILNDEKSIDFKQADKERNSLIDRINAKLSKVDMEELVIKTLFFKSGDITNEDFYAYLFKKARFCGVDFSALPNLVKYSEYVKRYEALDKAALMKEMKALEDALIEKAAKTEDQKALYSLDKDLAVMRGMFNISLIKDEFDYYTANRDNFSAKRFLDFINKKAPLYGLFFKLNDGITRLDYYRENMEKFYTYSLKRDEAFIKNIEKKMREARRDVTILVTGGFHTGNLSALFKDKGFSYIEVMPKFQKTDVECPYFRLLSGGQDPITKAIMEGQSSIQIATILEANLRDTVYNKGEITAIQDAVAVLRSAYEFFAALPEDMFFKVALDNGSAILLSRERGLLKAEYMRDAAALPTVRTVNLAALRWTQGFDEKFAAMLHRKPTSGKPLSVGNMTSEMFTEEE